MGVPLLAIAVQVLGLFHAHAAVFHAGARRVAAVVDAGALRVDDTRQERLALHGPVRVELPGLVRTYPGDVEVTAHGGELRIVTTVPLEEYAAAVAAAELGPSAPAAALEALAIVARSAGLAFQRQHRHPGGALCDTTHCQLYQGGAHAAARAAAQATRGLVLVGARGVPAPALHHAACAGRTANAAEIWPRASAEEREAGVAVDDPGPACAPKAGEPPLAFRASIDEGSLARALGVRPPIDLGGAFTHEQLHLAWGRVQGWQDLRSPRFTLRREGGRLVAEGRGHGHGVGLCQRGAVTLATNGANRHLLLARYFPRLRVARLRD